jgi:DNA-binding CsgD family transcriptional regulator
MLVGRFAERASLERLLADAREGRSGVLLLRGEPGIGKTALLSYAAAQAQGFTVVQTRGVESEAELAFAGLADLTRPLLYYLPGLPRVQAAALKGALALGPPVTGDRFTIAVATLTLLGAAAERQPLLVVVDDAHWLDGPSAEVIGFVARRLQAEGIVLLLAMRDTEPATLDVSGLAELTVHGLDPAAAESLIHQQVATPVAAGVAVRLARATAGNPLALLEVPALLSAEQLAGTVPLQEPLPAGESIQRAFFRRVAKLLPPAQTAVLVAAASDSSELSVIATAASQLGANTKALEAAEAAGLLRLGGLRVEFRHSLLRAAVYHGATAPARRAAHRALAAAFEDAGDADRSAWQLAAATLTPDGQVAEALEQTGLRARDRGGYGAAAHALQRAAQLSPTRQQRMHRLLVAAEAFWFAGQLDHAVHVLDQALPLAADPGERADLQYLRGRIEQWRGDLPVACRLLIDEAERIARSDPARAAMMLADTIMPSIASGQMSAALETARRGQVLAQGCQEAVQRYASLSVGLALSCSGQAREGYPLIRRACEALEHEAHLMWSSPLVVIGWQVGTWVEDWGTSRRALGQAIETARAQSAPGMLLTAHLAVLSELNFRAGRWNEAAADAAEAIQLARDTGQRTALAFGLICAARVHAARGEERSCRASVVEAREIASQYGIRTIDVYASSVLGLLELGLGNLDAAISSLEPLSEIVTTMGLGEPAMAQWAPDHIEACIRAGRIHQAGRELQRFEREAKETGRTWALATTARCHGLLTDPADAEPAFSQAYQWHAHSSMPFELARTQLGHGQQLRRAKQRTAARDCLRAALAMFEHLDARPWANQASAELQATGETARRRTRPATSRLTPQEFQVARLVADGRSNRDIAAALFLSVKTVEFHLGSIHRKLATTSRAQLVRLLLQRPPSPSATTTTSPADQDTDPRRARRAGS